MLVPGFRKGRSGRMTPERCVPLIHRVNLGSGHDGETVVRSERNQQTIKQKQTNSIQRFVQEVWSDTSLTLIQQIA